MAYVTSPTLICSHLSLVTAPALEPVTIAEMKAHLRLDGSNAEPAPGAPTAALAAVPIAGNIENGAHRYGVTFVTADGETELGTVTAAVTVADKTVNGKIELTAIPIGGSAVTSRNIYRTTAGGSSYLLQSTLADNTTTILTDNTADASLGAAAPSTNSTSDPELVAFITSARLHCEAFTERAFITQTWDQLQDSFPYGSRPLVLQKAPLLTSTAPVVTYTDTNGTAGVPWAAGNYSVDAPAGPFAKAGRLVPVYMVTYPGTRIIPNAVNIRFVAGYGAAASAVPSPIKLAIKMLVAYWYDNRESVGDRPQFIDDLLMPYTMGGAG